MKKLLLVVSFAIVSLGCEKEKIIKFQADIKNNNIGTIAIFVTNNLENEIVKEMKSDAKGHFEANFKGKEGLYYLAINDTLGYNLYLKDGYDLKMTADAKNLKKTLTFSGKGSDENNFLIKESLNEGYKYMNSLYSDKSFLNLSIPLDEKLFNKALNDLHKDLEFIENSDFDPTFVEFKKPLLKEVIKSEREFYSKYQAIKKLSKEPLSFPTEYENYAGGKTKLEEFKGKYMYIDCWATWCAVCISLTPDFKLIEEKYKNKNIVFIGISGGRNLKEFNEWKTFIKKNKMTGVQLFQMSNPSANDSFIQIRQYGTIPRFILIDPTGKIIKGDIWPTDPKLQEILYKLL